MKTYKIEQLKYRIPVMQDALLDIKNTLTAAALATPGFRTKWLTDIRVQITDLKFELDQLFKAIE